MAAPRRLSIPTASPTATGGGGTTPLVGGGGTATGTGGNKKPGENLQNAIRNNPISKAINNTLDHIKDSLTKKDEGGSEAGTPAGASTGTP